MWTTLAPNFKNQYPDGIIAYRGKVDSSAIGNPFSVTNRGEDTVKQFIEWITTGNNFGVEKVLMGGKNYNLDELRDIYLKEIKNGKGKKILYYKELDRPSHATALDYLINKYDWNTPKPTEPIIKEVERDIYNGFDIHVSSEYSLRRWAIQGVLLLNTALTVEESTPGSHIKLWKPFTEYIFKILNENNSGLIFMLWGNEAQKYEELINTNLHYIIEAGHPSPLNTKLPFVGNGCFSKCNKILEKNNNIKIIW
jgi:uracil-DNA glycosylase